LDDEEALRQQREEERAKAASERLTEAYNELKQGNKAQDMKEQEIMRLQMQVCVWVCVRVRARWFVMFMWMGWEG